MNNLWDFQDKLKDLGHYQTKYKSIEDLKYQFGSQLRKIIRVETPAATEEVAHETVAPGKVVESSSITQSRSPALSRSAIKGLRSFTFEDADLFFRLQRQTMLEECFRAIVDREFKLGILFGESGCGKTSFLQAGLAPILLRQRNDCLPIYIKQSHIIKLIYARSDIQEMRNYFKNIAL